jgi:excinuclease UvrABC ATPase subunit
MGAIKPMQTPAWQECQDDLMRHAETAGIPRDTPWNKLTAEQHHWVIKGSPNWNGKWNQQWYGIKRFFEYLETKSYKMHIRVLLVQVPQLHHRAATATGRTFANRQPVVAHRQPCRCLGRHAC